MESMQGETLITTTFDGLSPTTLEVPALTIIAHPDPSRVGEVVILTELRGDEAVKLSRLEPAFAAPGSFDSKPLAISHLSRQPIILRADGDSGVKVVRAGSRTAVDIAGERLQEERVLSTDDLRSGVVLDLGHRVVLMLHYHHPLDIEVPSFGMVGESTPMIRVRQEVHLVAHLDTPVLVRGESGTGKDLLARAIHEAGPRGSESFVPVNLPAITPATATAELFGSIADEEQEGCFRHADGGTLFLDEIGDVHPDVQQVLLRALENSEVQPVGSDKPIKVDLRAVAATDADLEVAVAEGRFKAQLLHRVAAYEIRLPPLRERRSDFGRLLYHFLREELAILGEDDALTAPDASGRPWPPADLVARLASFDWPGNVRQLRNAARRLAVARQAGTSLSASILERLVDPSTETGTFERSDVVRELEKDAANETVRSTSEDPEAEDTLVSESLAGKSWEPVYKKPKEVRGKKFREALKAHRFDLDDLVDGLPKKKG